MRLLTMGLRVGDVMDIITNFGEGQVVVAVSGKRYALGYDHIFSFGKVVRDTRHIFARVEFIYRF